jgi:hypothetical protein
MLAKPDVVALPTMFMVRNHTSSSSGNASTYTSMLLGGETNSIGVMGDIPCSAGAGDADGGLRSPVGDDTPAPIELGFGGSLVVAASVWTWARPMLAPLLQLLNHRGSPWA